MEILQHIWGSTPEGEAIVLYTIRNANGCEVQLCNIGASIVSVKCPDRDGHIDDVVLGYKDCMSYFGDGAASGKSVGRVANRIARGRMTVDGVEYNLEVNNGPNHLHGGSKGFANRLWDARVETNRVVFSLTSPDGEQNYPGELYVEAGYYFSDDDELEITYMARTDKTTVVNLTNHVYWNLAGEGSGKSILDHELHLNCSRVLEMDPTPRREGHAAGFHRVAAFRRRDTVGVQPHEGFQGIRPLLRSGRLETQYPQPDRRASLRGFGPQGRGAVVAGGSDGIYGQLARGRMPRNQVGRPLRGLCGRGHRVPELSRRGEPARFPVGGPPSRGDLLPEDSVPFGNVLIL